MVESSQQNQAATEPSQTTNLKLSGPNNDKDTSYAIVINNKDTSELEEHKPFTQVVNKGLFGNKTEFELLHRLFRQPKPMYTDCQHMDIYKAIHPFKETAILIESDAEDADSRYINANRIKSPYNEADDMNLIIAAQGPISSSMANFWRMVH